MANFGKRMKYRALRTCALWLALMLSLLSAAFATSETTLTVQLKGVTFDGTGWRSVTLRAPIRVLSSDGAELGTVVAGGDAAAGESDTLSLSGVSQVRLEAAQPDGLEGFAFVTGSQAAITEGQSNLATVFAYAKQGYYRVENVRADGTPAAGAEYALMTADGSIVESFTTDESGSYRSVEMRPAGAYRLVQMRAADGTLPMAQPMTVEIGTYFGNESDVQAVRIVSEPVPTLDASVGQLQLEKTDFAKSEEDEQRYIATMQLSGLCDGQNNAPLAGVSLQASLDGFVDADGGFTVAGGAAALSSVVIADMQGARATVDALDASGALLATLPVEGETLLPENTQSVLVHYLNENGGDALPVGFHAGTLTVTATYVETEQPTASSATPVAIRATATPKLQYTYLDVDGASTISRSVELNALSEQLFIPDGRVTWQVYATASGSQVTLSAEAGLLADETPVIVSLPDNARVQASLLENHTALLRLRDHDVLLLSAKAITDGFVMEVATGRVDELTIVVRDPLGLPETDINPYGAYLRATRYNTNLMWDALIASQGGVYTPVRCLFAGAVSKATDDDYGYVAATGTALSTAGDSTRRCAVVLRRGDTDVYYGTNTETNGAFVIYMPSVLRDDLGQPMTLRLMLPTDAVFADTGASGYQEKGITLPTMGNQFIYSTHCGISGTLEMVDGGSRAGIAVTLLQNGATVAQAVTDPSGAFTFSGLQEGAYALSLNAAEGSQLRFQAENGLTVSLDGASAQTDVFTLSDGAQQSVHISAEFTASVNGVALCGGAPVAGLSLTLGEQLTTTDENGAFAFSGLSAGSLTLSLTPPEGMYLSAIGDTAMVEEGSMTLTLAAGATLPLQISLSQYSAITCGASELGGGQQIAIASIAAQASTQTAADGSFAFEKLAAGEYTVYAPLPTGVTLRLDSPWHVTQLGDMIYMTTAVAEGETATLTAPAFVARTSIEGCAYVDENGNTARDEGEQLMSGVSVALQHLENEQWVDISAAATDAYGAYGFYDLPEGDYRVCSTTDSQQYYVAAVGAQEQRVGDTTVMQSGVIALRDGQRSTGEADVALRTPAALHFAAFEDGDHNTVRGPYEQGVANVTVEVLSGETVLLSGTTDTSGECTLSGVMPGAHALRVTLPNGYAFTTMADASAEVATSEALSFTSGQTTEATAGMYRASSFSGKVFEDANNDGLMDADEPGVAGVVLHLEGLRTGASYTLTTDETGEYRFGGLQADTYRFYAELPDGMLFARYSRTGGDLRSVFTGSTLEREFGVGNAADVVDKNVGVIQKGVVSGMAFVDLNYNGLYDEGEPGYAGVTLELIRVSDSESLGRTVSAEDGSYRFEGLRGSEYRLRAILPDNGSTFTVVNEAGNLFEQRSGRRENSIQPITLRSGGEVQTLVGVALGGSISGAVFTDADYDGIISSGERMLSNIRVELVDEAGNVIVTDTTDGSGAYTLEGIMPGAYTVRFNRRAGNGFTRLRPENAGGSHVVALVGEYGVTAAMEIAMDQHVTDVNAGMLPAATLSGVLFNDLNDNGLRDEGEIGYNAATVRLLSDDGEIDLTSAVSDDGSYFFDGVMPGAYTLSYLLPEHSVMAQVAEGGNTVSDASGVRLSVAMGEAHVASLAGAVTLGSFEGFVFHDINANGVEDAGEERMAGATVSIAPDGDAARLVTVQTSTDGAFSLVGLRPADYVLTVALPDGYIFSHTITSDALDLPTANTHEGACPWAALVSRAQKAIGAVRPATLSGEIWLDENKNAQRDASERMLDGVVLQLVDESTGLTVQSLASTEAGYVFDSVRPGSYVLRFALPSQSEPAGEQGCSFNFEGGQMRLGGIVIAESGTISGLNAGIVSRTSIGGRVWLEAEGERTAVAGVTVRLYRATDTEPLQTTATTETGSYQFDGLWPDNYRLEADLPDGMIFVEPTDPNYDAGASVIVSTQNAVGTSDAFPLAMASHLLDQNMIFIKPAKVGDTVWLDENANGLIDGTERRLSGVTIRLMQNGVARYEMVSDAYGYYLFDSVYPGAYTIEAVAYPQLTLAPAMPALRIISSCLTTGDGTLAQSDPFTVESGTTNTDYNLGYVLPEGQPLPEGLVAPPTRDWTLGNTPKEG